MILGILYVIGYFITYALCVKVICEKPKDNYHSTADTIGVICLAAMACVAWPIVLVGLLTAKFLVNNVPSNHRVR